MKTYSQTQRNYMLEGKNQDQLLRQKIRFGIGVDKHKVQAKRHTIISGPPGIGKSYSTMDEIDKGQVNYIQFGADASDSAIACELAWAVSNLGPKEELVVLLDDSDNIIFQSYEAANRWKMAMGKVNPFYSYEVNLTLARKSYEKSGRMDLVQAIDAFTQPGQVGIKIPMDRVRFVVICNKDLEDKKQFRGKIWDAVEAIVDRVRYERLDFEWRVSWGWLAYILENTQPFKDYELDDLQKQELCSWLWTNWDRMRNPSYRSIEEMAEYMINFPDSYEDNWQSLLKKDRKYA